MTENEYYIKTTKAKRLSDRFIRECMQDPKFRSYIIDYMSRNSIVPTLPPVIKRVSEISIIDTNLVFRQHQSMTLHYNVVSYKGNKEDQNTNIVTATFGTDPVTIDRTQKIITVNCSRPGTYNLVVHNSDGDIVYNKEYNVLPAPTYSIKIINRPTYVDSTGFVIIDVKSTVTDENGTHIWSLPDIIYDNTKFTLETTTISEDNKYRLKFVSISDSDVDRTIRIGNEEIRLSVVVPTSTTLTDTSLYKDDTLLFDKDASYELFFLAYDKRGSSKSTSVNDFIVEYDNTYIDVTRENLSNFYYKLTLRTKKQVIGKDTSLVLKVSYKNNAIMRNILIKKIPLGRVVFGTHNSCTFAKFGGSFFEGLLQSKSTCQRINLQEQYDMGVRYFDLRPKCSWRGGIADDDGYTYHGIGKYKYSVKTALDIINKFPERCYVRLYHEGNNLDAFVHYVKRCKEQYTNILYYNTSGRAHSKENVLNKMSEIGCPSDSSLRPNLVEHQCHGDFGANLLITSPLGWAQDHNIEYYNRYKQEAETSGIDQLCIFDFVDKLRNLQ